MGTKKRMSILAALLSLSLVPLVCATDNGTEVYVTDDLTVYGSTGTALDPDVEVKGFTVFGSTQSVYPGNLAISSGSVVVNSNLTVSSGVYIQGGSTITGGSYFVGASTFTSAVILSSPTFMYIGGGADGQVMTKDAATGALEWASLTDMPLPGDSLGNHVATTTLNMATFGIVGASSITANYLTAYSTMTVAGDAFSVGGSTFVVRNGMVGIGLGASNPTVPLDVQGSGDVARFNSSAGWGTMRFLYGGSSKGNIGYTGNSTFFNPSMAGAMIVQAEDGIQLGVGIIEATVNITTDNVVGIGLRYPDEKLHVDGNIKSNYGVNASTGLFSSALTVKGPDFSVGVSTFIVKGGLVGISTGAPQARLDVVGHNASAESAVQIWRSNSGVAVATVTAAGVFQGDGSGLVSIISTSAVSKTGDTMAGVYSIQPGTLSITNAGMFFSVRGDGSIISTGVYPSGAPIPAEGAGTRFMWYPSKAAIRAGGTSGADWDDANVGAYSVAFGYNNVAKGSYPTAVGGYGNQANGQMPFTGGGYLNFATGDYSAVVAGQANKAQGNYSFAGGGANNTASGQYSVVPGGMGNVAFGDYSFAGGLGATATARGSFVWADSQGGGLLNTTTDQFLVKAAGGFNVISPTSTFTGRVGIGTAAPSALLEVRDFNASSAYSLMVGTGTQASLVVTSGGIVGIGTFSPSTNTALNVHGRSFNANPGEDYSTAIIAEIEARGTDVNDVVVGGHFGASVHGDSPLKYLVGVYTRLERRDGSGSGTVDGAFGLYLDTPENMSVGGGKINNTIGIYIATQTYVGQLNAPYAIYSEDPNARSYFAGNVGISSAVPAYALVVSSGPDFSGIMLAVSTGASNMFTVAGNGDVRGGKFYGDGSGLVNVTASGDNLGSHVATMTLAMGGWDMANVSTVSFKTNVFLSSASVAQYGGLYVSSHVFLNGELNMNGFRINDVSTITMLNGDIAIVPPGTVGSNTGYGISIGSGSYNNYNYGLGFGVGTYNNRDYGVGVGPNAFNNFDSGVGVGAYAYQNYTYGVGVGPSAYYNHTRGVGVGANAQNNYTLGVGVGYNASNNSTYGVGVGNNASSNGTYGVGIGHNASGNDTLAVGIGAYSQDNYPYGTGVGAYTQAGSSSAALGAYAKALNQEALALGAGARANAFQSVCIGAYCVNNDTATVKIRESYTFMADTITVSGDISGLTLSTNVFIAGNVGISTSIPQARLDVTAEAGAESVQIWRNSGGTVISSISASGVITASTFNAVGSAYMMNGKVVIDSESNIHARTLDVTEPLAISTFNVTGNQFSVGGSTFVVANGVVGVGTGTPQAALDITAPSGFVLKVSTNGFDPILSVSSSGVAVGSLERSSGSLLSVSGTAPNLVSAQEEIYEGVRSYIQGTNTDFFDVLVAGGFETKLNSGWADYVGGIHTSVRINSGAAATNAVGLFVDEFEITGGATNVYGILISTLTRPGQTNPSYALYSEDAQAYSYFAGPVGIGTDTPKGMLMVVSTTSTGDAPMAISQVGSAYPSGIIGTKANGTPSALVPVNTGDRLFSIRMRGYDGSSYKDGATIESLVDGTPSANIVPARLEFQTAEPGSGALKARLTIKSDGAVGISTNTPQAMLDIMSTSAASGYIQIWRDSTGFAVASMTASGQLYAAIPGDGMGNHIATTTVNMNGWNIVAVSSVNFKSNVFISSASEAENGGLYVSSHVFANGELNMNGFRINNVSTITMLNGSIAIVPPGTIGSSSEYAISIGSGAYNNYDHGLGVGVEARNNFSNGVGVGFNANGNASNGVGVGYNANANSNNGVGVGYNAYGNSSAGVGVGFGANNNNTSGVGVGAGASGNANYAVGIGAQSMNNATYGTGVGAYSQAGSSSAALGANAKALNQEALALGVGARANAIRSVCIGAYCVNNDTETAKIKEGYALRADTITVSGNIAGLTVSTNMFITGNVSLSTATAQARLDVTAATGADTIQIWRNAAGTVVSSISASGIITASTFNAVGSSYMMNGKVVIDSNSNIFAKTIAVEQPMVISTINVTGSEFSVGGSTLVVRYGTVGIGTGTPQAALDVVSTGSAVNDYAQIWRNSGGTVVASMTATGRLYTAVPNGDNLGNHIATTTITADYGITSSTAINAGYYQINGSTVLAILPGNGSLGVGPYAGPSNTGNYNVFVGSGAGFSNVALQWNTFVGYAAGYSNVGGESNTFVGTYAGIENTSGDNNSFFGHAAGSANTIGSANSFLGDAAGNANTDGTGNSFVGAESGRYNVSGSQNSFMGSGSGYSNTVGSYNSFIGDTAGYSNTNGAYNALLGANAGWYNETGYANAVIGFEAGNGAAGSAYSSSTLAGYQAGYSLTTGDGNILLGYKAGYDISTGTGNIVIGYNITAETPGTNSSLNIGGAIRGNLADGKIGIGNKNPLARLDVIQPDVANSSYTLRVGTAPETYHLAVSTNGNVGIGIPEPKVALDVNGAVKIGAAGGDFPGTIRYNGTFEGYNGSTWLSFGGAGGWSTTALPSIYNNAAGTVVGIGIQPADNKMKLHVYSTTNTAGGHGIYSHMYPGPGVGVSGSYGLEGSKAAVAGLGDANGAGTKIFGVAGYLSGTNKTESAGVFGAPTMGSSGVNPVTWGALGYRDASAREWAGYFNGSITVVGAGVFTTSVTVNETLTASTGIFTTSLQAVANKSAVEYPLSLINRTGTSQNDGVGMTFIMDSSTYSAIAGVKTYAGIGDKTGHISFFASNNGGTITETARITSAGMSIGMGTNPISKLHVISPSGVSQDNQLVLENVSGADSAFKIISQKAKGDFGGRSILADNDTLLEISGDGYTGTANVYDSGAKIKMAVDGTPIVTSAMPGRIEFYTTPSGSLVSSLGMVIKNNGYVGIATGTPQGLFDVKGGTFIVKLDGAIGMGTVNPEARLDVVSTGTASNQYAQIWRNSGGTVVASMTATGRLYTAVPNGDNLGNHTATTMLDMGGFAITGVSTITMWNGSLSIVPPGTNSLDNTYGISIGSGAYDNYDYGVGLGYKANGNYSNGVGVGNSASGNLTNGVGLGFNANGNSNSGVGVGANAYGNSTSGVGVGPNAYGNTNSGVGIGANAYNNSTSAVGIGANSQGNAAYGTGVGAWTQAGSSSAALGYYARANNQEALALGAGATANAYRSICIGAYCVNNNVETAKIKEGYTLLVDSLTVSGNVRGVTLSTNVFVTGGEFSVNGSTLIVKDGKVGIGITPAAMLDVRGVTDYTYSLAVGTTSNINTSHLSVSTMGAVNINGSLTVNGPLKANIWQRIYRADVTSPQTSIQADSLDPATKEYKIILNLVLDTGGSGCSNSGISMQLSNSSSGNSFYVAHISTSNGTSWGGYVEANTAGQDSLRIGNTGLNNSEQTFVEGTLSVAASTSLDSLYAGKSYLYTTTSRRLEEIGGSIGMSASDLTWLRISAGTSGCFGNGTSFELWALR